MAPGTLRAKMSLSHIGFHEPASRPPSSVATRRRDDAVRITPSANHGELISFRYESLSCAEPPIPVTKSIPRAPPVDLHPAFRRQPGSASITAEDEGKRDSGLATSASTVKREGSVSTLGDAGREDALERRYHQRHGGEGDGASQRSKPSRSSRSVNSMAERASTKKSASPPATPDLHKAVSSSASLASSCAREESPRMDHEDEAHRERACSPTITTDIPTDNLMDEAFLGAISFSKRGSIMFGGKKAVPRSRSFGDVESDHDGFAGAGAAAGGAAPDAGLTLPRMPQASHHHTSHSFRIDVPIAPTMITMPGADPSANESQKVRSLYEQGTALDWRDGAAQLPSIDAKVEPINGRDTSTSESDRDPITPVAQTTAGPHQGFPKTQHERAGGVEDWEDINTADVDRYGFIVGPLESSPHASSPIPRSPHRTSTALQMASESPRKRRTLGHTPSLTATSFRNSSTHAPSTRLSIARASNLAQRSTSRNSLRAAANRLPYNADRRCLDEAGDMLTLPPALAEEGSASVRDANAAALKLREWERAEKWRRMARVDPGSKKGESMEFVFDTRNAKLIERTWKGIPDRWRAAAWWSFLSSAAATSSQHESPSVAAIIQDFHRLLEQDSPDDVQIDIDVPRTINAHIMFRRRYRGGQRLLFRVLHSLSLYFPKTGYVQGMASLAATLLCYFEEEKCFVMLVRMWTLRGLARLYESGFGGLMEALEDFQRDWLAGGVMEKKLEELNIPPTAYGTRWYLTLFNYSIPFAAQLRVWDVFMLSPAPHTSPFSLPHLTTSVSTKHLRRPQSTNPVSQAGTTTHDDSPGAAVPAEHHPDSQEATMAMAVLHATSAALIDGTRDILFDSDFETAMKVLTGWIPLRDEDLLMRVARAEWRARWKRR